MGFGLPAAIGAKAAAPHKVVVDIDGDASFSMTAMELQTASQYDIGVKVLVLNNEFQGMVLQWQDLFYDNRYSHTRMTNPDFVKLAQAMNVHAIRVTSAEELPAKMKEFLEYDGSRPVLMECIVETNEHVFPMVSNTVTLGPRRLSTLTGVRRYPLAKHCTNRSSTLPSRLRNHKLCLFSKIILPSFSLVTERTHLHRTLGPHHPPFDILHSHITSPPMHDSPRLRYLLTMPHRTKQTKAIHSIRSFNCFICVFFR